MNKIKNLRKHKSIYLTVNSIKGQVLNLNEVEMINEYLIDELIAVNVTSNNDLFILIYEITGYKKLSSFLQSDIDEPMFTYLISNVFNFIKDIERNHLSISNILLDHDYVFVDTKHNQLLFIYLPIQQLDNNTSIKQFYLDLVYNSVFPSFEDFSYIQKYLDIIDKETNFSLFELEQYINKMYERNSDIIVKRTCPTCKIVNSGYVKICSNCGSSLISKEKPLTHKENKNSEPEINTLNNKAIKNNKTPEGKNSTNLLDKSNIKSLPFLLRETTEETLVLNKSIHNITKEFYGDINIEHIANVDITYRENLFHIINHSPHKKVMLDGRVIPSYVEIELITGTRITLNGEDFTFYS